MVLLLFLVNLFGEAAFGIPYVLESVWLMVGYQLGAGVLSPWSLAGLFFFAQLGRQIGAVILYQAGRYGSIPLLNFYRRRISPRLSPEKIANSKILNRVNLASPFSVALGRLLAMRIPITLALGAKRKLKTLSIGVFISSLIWDAGYIAVGAIFGSTAIVKPLYMFIASLVSLTIIYTGTFAIRHLFKNFRMAAAWPFFVRSVKQKSV